MPTSSRTASSTPRLSEYARKFVFPPGITKTVWPRIEAKGLELGLGFDWWQAQLGSVCVGYGDDGKYVATVGGIGMSIPRQVGKTYFVLALLVIMCILFPGLQVVWTAHHLRTSTKTFTALRGICRRKKVAPFIAKNDHGRDAIRTANGEQQVTFTNGSVIMFGARALGFGRGFDEIDIEVYDEAQILDTKALEDMVAATNQARHEHGALLFFMGTPPRPTDPSDAFTQRRKEARDGEAEDAIWLEIGADPASDPNDEAQWLAMNPSFPLRTPVESLQRLRKNLKDEDSWNREGRGIWDEELLRRLDPRRWHTLADPSSQLLDPVALALDIRWDEMAGAVAVSGVLGDGLRYGELVEPDPSKNRVGTGWMLDRVVEIADKQQPCVTVLDPSGPAGRLVPELEKRGFERVANPDVTVSAGAHRLYLVSGREYAQACGALAADVRDATWRHRGQMPLNDAVEGARTAPLADAWKWSRKDSGVDISPLVAVTLARLGHVMFGEQTGAFFAAWR